MWCMKCFDLPLCGDRMQATTALSLSLMCTTGDKLRHMEDQLNWYERITTDSQRQVARLVGVSHTTLSRAVSSSTPPPTLVRDVARACGVDPLTALYYAGFLTADDVATRRGVTPLNLTPSRELLQELLRREVAALGDKPRATMPHDAIDHE